MNTDGFIDLHTHGFGGYDTRTADPEDILKIAELHGKAGTTSILPTIYSGSIVEMRRNMEAVKKAMEIQNAECGMRNAESDCSIKAGRRASAVSQSAFRNPNSALILGVHLEGPFLNPVRCGALDKRSFITPTVSALKKLTCGYEEIIRIITIAPEMPGALRVIEKCAGEGIRIHMGHSDATYREAADGKGAGATGITHLFNAMRPFHHREPGLAGFGLLDDEVYVEVIADGIHLRPETLRLIFSLKRNDRIILVSDSVSGAKGDGTPVYRARDILAGSGITIRNAADLLEKLGIPVKTIMQAGKGNPAWLVRKR